VTARRCLAVVLAGAVGCAPSLPRLERGHHYNEAICGAAEHAFSEADVLAALRRGLDPAVHVTTLAHADLVAAVGDELPELRDHALVHVVFDTNQIPLAHFDASFGVRRGDRVRGAEVVDLPAVAALLRESVPGPQTIGPSSVGQAASAIGTIGAVVLTVASLGLLRGLLRGGASSSGSRTITPTAEELRRSAPRASAVLDAVGHLRGRCDRSGERCSTLLWIDRAAAADAALALTVELRYHGCTYLHDSFEIPLPAGTDLQARLDARFGAHMRRLSELPTRATRTTR